MAHPKDILKKNIKDVKNRIPPQDDTGYISPYRARQKRIAREGHIAQMWRSPGGGGRIRKGEQARQQLLDIHMKSKKSGIK